MRTLALSTLAFIGLTSAAFAAGAPVEGSCTYTSWAEGRTNSVPCEAMVGRVNDDDNVWMVLIMTEHGAMAIRGNVGSLDATEVDFWKAGEEKPTTYPAPVNTTCKYNFTRGPGSGWCVVPRTLKVEFSGTLGAPTAPSTPKTAPIAPVPKSAPKGSALEELRDRMSRP